MNIIEGKLEPIRKLNIFLNQSLKISLNQFLKLVHDEVIPCAIIL